MTWIFRVGFYLATFEAATHSGPSNLSLQRTGNSAAEAEMVGLRDPSKSCKGSILGRSARSH